MAIVAIFITFIIGGALNAKALAISVVAAIAVLAVLPSESSAFIVLAGYILGYILCTFRE